jgi:nitrate reductase delta subunit
VLAKDPALDPTLRVRLAVFAETFGRSELLDLQAAYVDLFDRSRSLSLHLFEHVHGESRDRGQAMVSLRERYRAAGLDIAANELPDYLPLFLEFLSVLPPAEAQAMLAETAHILRVLGERLEKRQSPYALIFQALDQLAAAEADPAGLAALRDAPCDNPDDLAALDRSWEEAEVRFGAGDAAADSCPRATDMLARMRVPAEDFAGDKA